MNTAPRALQTLRACTLTCGTRGSCAWIDNVSDIRCAELQVRHVALRLCAQAKTVDDVVRAIVAMLRRHNVLRAHFAAHSFGTFVVAHLRHLYPTTVLSLLLCDPVRFFQTCADRIIVVSQQCADRQSVLLHACMLPRVACDKPNPCCRSVCSRAVLSCFRTLYIRARLCGTSSAGHKLS